MNLKSRKLIALVVIFLTSTIMLYTGSLNADLWVDIVKWSFGIYAMGNVGEHYTKQLEK